MSICSNIKNTHILYVCPSITIDPIPSTQQQSDLENYVLQKEVLCMTSYSTAHILTFLQLSLGT